MPAKIEALHRYEIPGRVAVVAGNGGLAKLVVTTKTSAAEIYPHGAHVTHFQKHGEPPLLFLSRQSWFALDKPIRGGVPICFPWFGNREGEPSHGFARITVWELVHSAAAADGAVTLRFALPRIPGREAWSNLRTEFVVTVADTLTMELTTANEACGDTLELENCLHSYFHVGDIGAVGLVGLHNAPFLDTAAGAKYERKTQSEQVLPITGETNRIYTGATGPVEIHDEKLRRIIRVEKQNSRSTVVWNPWTTQKLPNDFDPAEHRQMVCVEAGNVNEDRITLPAGQSASLRVVLGSQGF